MMYQLTRITRSLYVATLLCTSLQAMAQKSTSDCLRGHSRSTHCQQLLRNYWQHEPTIRAIAAHYGLEPALLLAVVAVESQYNARARSPAGALGLAQVMPDTARGEGLEDPKTNLYRPELALATGAAYLRKMWFEFRNWELALAAYNAGPGAVRKHKGIPPYRETQAYVPMVLALYREFASVDATSGR